MSRTTMGLLLLDYQVALCDREGTVGAATGLAAHVGERDVLRNAARCLQAARDSGVFVAHARVAFDSRYTNRTNRSDRFGGFERNGLLRRDDAQAQFCDEVAPAAGEVVVEKGCVSPFVGTNLFEVLTSRGIRELYLGGVATNFVVESAARHAGDSGFAVTVLDDCCASYNDEMHAFSVERVLPVFATVATSGDFVRTVASRASSDVA